ncbi:MAG TPA: hypothetical protein DCE23_05400 [Firmicutes bacterium]|nr:hypothetical protein [Bacillota bacterium]
MSTNKFNLNNIYEKIKTFMKENWSFLLSVIVIILVFFVIKLPYEVEMPGGIINLNDRVEINGEKREINGSLNMAYVSVVEGRIPYILLGLILPDWDVNPTSEVTYENETIEEANNRNILYLEQSKAYATSVAFDAANIPYEKKDKENSIIYIDSEAKTNLKVGDKILEFDGQKIEDMNLLSSLVQEKEEGKEITLKVNREGKEVEAQAIIFKRDDKKYLGISAITLFEVISDKKIEIKSRSAESGPSGGLMMTLAVYNAIADKDLTNGKKVVGTGTINLDGTVGAIGGVKYKLMGAVKEKADVFLVPEENYEEAMEVKKRKKYDIEIVSVKKLQDAIDYLENK